MEPKKILLVDDEPVNLKILKAMLRPEGYTIIEAENGYQALNILQHTSLDLILLDVMMPELDGFEVCKRIKAQKEKRMIPILMVTALQDKIHRQEAMEAGADDFLSKPIDRIELLIRVKSLLRIKQYSDELISSYKILEKKNRQLEELEKIKEGLTHMIIHDLRAPLTSISMNVDMCLMQLAPDSSLKKYLNNASSQCNYMNEMIQSLLDIHRMEEGKLKISKEPLKVASFIREVVGNYLPQIESKEITLKFEENSTYDQIFADYQLLKRVVSNLLDNAIRYTPKKGTIIISTEDSFDKKCFILTITDSGKGLDKKYHKKIFDKFEQVKLKKEGVVTGSIGLGLAFCKMAVELHNGKIWVSGNPQGKGCAFSFSLPANKSHSCKE